jgi:hypothetical protein
MSIPLWLSSLRDSAMPGKSYGEECPSWKKLPGNSSEERVAAIGPVMLVLQHSAISFGPGTRQGMLMSLNTPNPHPTT